MLDFIRGNRTSSTTIAITVGVSSFLLTLLCCVLFNFWADAAAQAAAEGIDWYAELAGDSLATALLYLVVLVLACIALVLIIRNAFAASMQNRLHQLGLLATVGATPRQIRALLLREALVLSLLPAVVGMALGILATSLFVSFASDLSHDVGIESAAPLVFRIHPLLIVAIIAIVLGTVAVSADLPARRLAKTSPLMAVAGAPETVLHHAGRPSFLARVFGIEGELAQGSLRQRRTALRSGTVAVGLAFLVLSAFLSFMTISRMSVEQTYYQRYGIAWDMVVDMPSASAEEADAIAQMLVAPVTSAMVDESDNGMRLYIEASGNDIAAIRPIVEDVLAASGQSDRIIVDMAADRQRSEAIWNGYVVVVGGFCGILALIGIAGIITQAIGSIYQRKREFARLRSIGMTPDGVFKMLSIEGLMTTIRPLAITLPFVVAIALLLAILGRQPLPNFLATFPYIPLLLYIGIILAIVVLANLIGATKLVRYDIAETLKNDTLV